MPGGRPTSYTVELGREICERVVAGRSLDSIGKDADMPSVSVIYGWLRQYTAFQEDYARARDIRSDKLGNEIIEIADTEEDPQKARNMIDARKWVASRMTPKKWGDRVEVEHSGSVQGMGAVSINIMPAQAAPVLAACAPVLDVQPEKPALPEGDK